MGRQIEYDSCERFYPMERRHLEVGVIQYEFEAYPMAYWHDALFNEEEFSSVVYYYSKSSSNRPCVSTPAFDRADSSFLLVTRKDYLCLLELVQGPTVAKRLKRVTLAVFAPHLLPRHTLYPRIGRNSEAFQWPSHFPYLLTTSHGRTTRLFSIGVGSHMW